MTTSTPAAETARKAMVRQYELVCLASLLVLGLVLVPRHGAWTLLPMLVGIQAIYLRMRGGPLLLLLALQFEVLDHWLANYAYDQFFDLAEVFQCAAVLGFIIGHYRLQGLTQSLLPGDPRQKPLEPSRRSADPRELVGLLLTLASWAVLVQFAWIALPHSGGELFRSAAPWRVIVLVWVVATAVILASGLLGYLRREYMTRDEAEMFFQDLLWNEHRGEQRRPNRWLAWARLRYGRRRNQSLDSFPPSDE